jgi:O-succinylbenzoic acid--CoA ligase
LIGRRDAVINSGGETLFLETLETRMGAFFAVMPTESFLLVGLSDAYWGERLVGLVRFRDGLSEAQCNDLLMEMGERCLGLTPIERPKQWLHCPALAVNAVGKWERLRWSAWAASQC